MKKRKTKKEVYEEYVKKVRARDVDYWLEFYKGAAKVGTMKIPENTAVAIQAAEAAYTKEHGLDSWSRTQVDKKDGG